MHSTACLPALRNCDCRSDHVDKVYFKVEHCTGQLRLFMPITCRTVLLVFSYNEAMGCEDRCVFALLYVVFSSRAGLREERTVSLRHIVAARSLAVAELRWAGVGGESSKGSLMLNTANNYTFPATFPIPRKLDVLLRTGSCMKVLLYCNPARRC
jgi:hypothetical protein